MPDTNTTVAEFQSACAEVADAIKAGNFAEAWKWYGVAEAINASLSVEGEAGGFRTKRRDRLDGLREAIQAAENAAGRYSGKSRRARTGVSYNT